MRKATAERQANRPLPGPPGAWVWPYWLERQLHPLVSSFGSSGAMVTNRTGRSWTRVGSLGSAAPSLVDRRALVWPAGAGWSLDWWIGAEDRWHLPSREAAVRQSLIGHAPVVETVMRVPSGDARSRVMVLPSEDGDVVVVEVANEASVPFAVGFAIRPAHVTGRTVIERIELEDAVVRVDGAVAVVALSAPRQAVLSTGASGDAAGMVLTDAAPVAANGCVTCPDGLATAVLIWPVTHRTSVAVALPVPRPPGRPALEARRRRRPALEITARAALARRVEPAAVARGWTAQAERLTRLELPAGKLDDAIEAQRRHLLLARPDGSRPREEEARIVVGLDQAGYHDEAAAQLREWWAQQGRHGALGEGAAATAAVLWASGRHQALAAEAPDAPDAFSVGRAVESLRTDRLATGDVPTRLWAIAGLDAAVGMLHRLAQAEAATTCRRWEAEQRQATLEAIEADLRRWADDDRLAAEASGGSSSVSTGLPLVVPHTLVGIAIGVVDAAGAAGTAARHVARRGSRQGGLWTDQPVLGLSAALTLDMAAAEVAAGGDPNAPLGWVMGAASPTWTWPDVTDAHSGQGVAGDGHSPLATAVMWTTARSWLVADEPGGLDLVRWLPPSWWGVGQEIHGLPTDQGQLSYALRWHGDRPALLWHLETTADTVRLRASGLDPGWSSDRLEGEALLAPVPPPSVSS